MIRRGEFDYLIAPDKHTYCTKDAGEAWNQRMYVIYRHF